MGTNEYLVYNALKIGLNEEIISKVVDLSAGSSISNVTINENINLYPNPSNGQFTLDFTSVKNQVSSVKIYDLVGKNVYSKDAKINEGANKLSIDVSNLTSGVYILNIENQKVKFTIK
jgi:methionine-rich copper-binding protein CopC